MTKGSDTRFST